MEYTTDTKDAVDSFLKDQYYQAKHQRDNHALDAASAEFLLGVVVAGGADASVAVELTARKDEAETVAVAQEAKSEVFLAKLDEVPSDDDYRRARIDWLTQYVASVEREHATHATIVQLSKEVGDTTQEESSTIAMLQCEAAHDASLKEIAVLRKANAGLVAEVAAVEG